MMNQKINRILVTVIIITVFIFFPEVADAQCSMCKATAESSLKEGGGGAVLGLNSGILYLASFPYIIALALGFLFYRNQQKRKQLNQKAELN